MIQKFARIENNRIEKDMQDMQDDKGLEYKKWRNQEIMDLKEELPF